MENIGNKIRAMREKKKYSRRELAAICNVAERTLQTVELGKADCSIRTLKKIAAALEMPAAYFLS